MDDRHRPERLSPLDASNLRIEDRDLPMHVAALVILEGSAGNSGQFSLDVLRETVRRRLHLVPRLRQVLYRPRFSPGPPVWVDDPRFDLDQHVRACAVPAPGTEDALLRTCSRLDARSIAVVCDQPSALNRKRGPVSELAPEQARCCRAGRTCSPVRERTPLARPPVTKIA